MQDGVVVDVADHDLMGQVMAQVAASVPFVTTLVDVAGIQQRLYCTTPQPTPAGDIAREVVINLTGLITATSAALPLLRRAPRSRVVHVGSGRGWCC